ncbi:MAG TPA: TadE/TadG family type IV pilus assembly protein [Allosphingosinicella sp.]|nr:TadE/TadG family type IV pilus assembly protein [Allosphingosinicella sp.]
MAKQPPHARGAIGSDERGTSVVELALLLPLLTILIVNITDLSIGITKRLDLHQAVHRTIELAAASTFQRDPETGEYDFSFLETQAAEAAGVDVEDVSVVHWLECDGVEQDDEDTICPAGEPIARYLQIRVDSGFTPMFGISVVGQGADYVPLFAEAAVRFQ